MDKEGGDEADDRARIQQYAGNGRCEAMPSLWSLKVEQEIGMPWQEVKPVVQPRVRKLCPGPYPNHPKTMNSACCSFHSLA